MSGYFRRLVARAGGQATPVSALTPTLPRAPRAADEADPFEAVAGPAPAANRPDDRAPRSPRASPRPVRGEAAVPSAEPAEDIAPRMVEPMIRAGIRPDHPVAAEPVARPLEENPVRGQQSVVPPLPPATPVPAPTDRREEPAAAPMRQEQASEPRPLSPQKPVEPIATRIGTVERIVERSRERPLEPRENFAQTPPMPPLSGQERATPPPVVTLSPPPPAEERAEAPTSDEPRLVIGRLQVEVTPPPAPARETVQVITRETPARPRSDGRASNLRFGLGQM